EKMNETIRELNILNDADEHNSDLVLDLSIFGRAYELVYRNETDETRFTVLDPLETFVIYDETVEQKPIAAVRYIGNQFKEDTTVYVYTDKERHVYSMNYSHHLKKKGVDNHYFKGVQSLNTRIIVTDKVITRT